MVLKLVEKYVSLKTGVRHSTVVGYKTVINIWWTGTLDFYFWIKTIC